MGLDMYVQRLTKPNKTSEELGKFTEDELITMGYSIIRGTFIPPNFESIREMTVEVQTVSEFVDFEKIKKDFNIPEAARKTWEMHGYPEITFEYNFEDEQGESYSAKFTEAELKKYKYPETITSYCFIMEEIAYWRKNYGLQSAIHRACDVFVENIGFYPMNEEMLKAVAEYDPTSYEKIAPYIDDENSMLAYHEWY